MSLNAISSDPLQANQANVLEGTPAPEETGKHNNAGGSVLTVQYSAPKQLQAPTLACGGGGPKGSFPQGLLDSKATEISVTIPTKPSVTGLPPPIGTPKETTYKIAVYGFQLEGRMNNPHFATALNQAANLAAEKHGANGAVFLGSGGKIYVGTITSARAIDVSHQVQYDKQTGETKVVAEEEKGYEAPRNGSRGSCGTPVATALDDAVTTARHIRLAA